MLLRLVLWTAVFAALGGCGGTTRIDLDGGLADGGVTSSGAITIEGESAIGIVPGESADFVARWLAPDGSAVADGALTFGLEGLPLDASLRSLGATTDADGRASGSVIAGAMPTTFRVRVSAAGARAAYLDVAIGADGFGAIGVDIRGGEGRAIVLRKAVLHVGTVSCADALARPEGDRMRPFPAGESSVELTALPAGQQFTVVARGESERGITLAAGCVEGVRVVRDTTIRVPIELAPAALGVSGEYDALLTLAPGPSGSVAIETLSTALRTAALTRGGDGALLLDALDEELRSLDQVVLADVLAAERLSGEPDATLERALDADGAGPTRALATILDEVIAPRADAITVEGTLAIVDDDMGTLASFARRTVLLGDASGERLTADLGARGIEPRTPATVRWSTVDDALAIDELRIDLPLGALVLAGLEGLASARGARTPTELLVDTGGCAALDAFVTSRSDLALVCTGTCVLDACKRALESTLAMVESGALPLDELRARVMLTGTLACEDADGDLAVDGWSAVGLTGSWSSADGTASEPVEASIDGARAVTLP